MLPSPVDGVHVLKKLASPRQVARAIGVSESTLKRWCDRGLIPMTKTAGGHRRIEVVAVVRFLRESGHSIAEPEVLGLPVSVGATQWTLDRAGVRIHEALVKGDDAVVRQVVFDLLIAGHSLTAICDDALTAALHQIGNDWACGEVAVYEERRACEICMRLLHELRATTATPDGSAPLAIGGTVAQDIYTIPVTIAELVLRNARWKATALGANLPFDTLQQAVTMTRPRLFWLSVSHIADEAEFEVGVNALFECVLKFKSSLAIGGQAVTESIRRRIRYTTFCETFRDLETFAQSLQYDAGQSQPSQSSSE